MVAETLTGGYAKNYYPTPGYGYNFLPVYGYYRVAANVEDGDIFELCKVPKNFLLWGGWFAADDIDTGTETLDIDLGWAANGGASETYVDNAGHTWTNAAGSGSATGLLNMGVLTGDAIATDLVAAGVNWRPIVLGTPKFFSRETIIQAEANAAANAFAAGGISCLLFGKII